MADMVFRNLQDCKIDISTKDTYDYDSYDYDTGLMYCSMR